MLLIKIIAIPGLGFDVKLKCYRVLLSQFAFFLKNFLYDRTRILLWLTAVIGAMCRLIAFFYARRDGDQALKGKEFQ